MSLEVSCSLPPRRMAEAAPGCSPAMALPSCPAPRAAAGWEVSSARQRYEKLPVRDRCGRCSRRAGRPPGADGARLSSPGGRNSRAGDRLESSRLNDDALIFRSRRLSGHHASVAVRDGADAAGRPYRLRHRLIDARLAPAEGAQRRRLRRLHRRVRAAASDGRSPRAGRGASWRVPVLGAVALAAPLGGEEPRSPSSWAASSMARRNLDEVNGFANSACPYWFETQLLHLDADRLSGARPRVYPGFLQHASSSP